MKPVLEEAGDNFYFGACIDAISKMHRNSSSDLMNISRFDSVKAKAKKGIAPLRRGKLKHSGAAAAGQGALVHESSIHNLKI
mmetsp:Transcript_42748/g.65697  ORF Transcript_42748/g.65697 Transcript_42748/m.65697 type:complete len:82 (+) Transcript_42748:4269-4514(+)